MPNIIHAITHTNPETKFHWQRIHNPVAGISSPQRRIQNPIMFPGFPYIGGQKCWDLSSDIAKTGEPSPPTPIKVQFWAKWVEGHNIAGGSWGEDGMNPKPNKKLSLGVGSSYVTMTWKGFFTQSQVLLSSTVDVGLTFCHVSKGKKACSG